MCILWSLRFNLHFFESLQFNSLWTKDRLDTFRTGKCSCANLFMWYFFNYYKVLAYFLYAGTKLLVPDSPKVLSCGLEANLGKVPSKVPISTICPTRSLSVVSFVISSLTSSNVGSWNKLGSKDSFTWRAFDASRCGRSMWCKKIWKFLSLWQHNHLLHPHASNARCVNAS